MSRNVRQKFPAPPTKVAKRRGSGAATSTNLSDDDGYSAVEDISDSEDDDEEDVDAAEEEHIITDESRATGHHSSGSPRPSDDGDDDGDDADSEEAAEENEADADIDDNISWDGILSDENESSTSDCSTHQDVAAPVRRHVRFVDVPSSDSDSTDTEDDHADFFPDLFVDQSTLDPAFRREIEGDEDGSSNSSAFWDFHGPLYEEANADDSEDATPIATPSASQDLPTDVSTPVPVYEDPQDLDGYESDGDTTEEDVPEPVIRKKVRRPDQSAESSDSDNTARLVEFRPGKPRLGSFDLNSSDRKPIAVVNPISRKMMIFTPFRRQHQHLDLSPEQFNVQYWQQMEEQSSPILSNSGGLMMGAMFSSHTFGDFMNTQAIGPAEAFFPFITNANTAEDSSDSAVDEEGDEAERNLDISDFITWEDGGESSDDEAGDGQGPDEWPEEGEESPSGRRPTTASSDRELLSHLNGDTVGAFRRNQLNQQLIASSKATQDSLAFSAPYNLTALRGLKSDRFQTAAAPLTPARRQKKSALDMLRSPLESASQKRKASGDHVPAHKRQRSISDVNHLQI